ncbi:MAG TPA: tripartite tricarboxylate transporter TctB family protein [Usitatibacteraceae bacterium]|nr:tripartite tricarboxylate transporter TctB family protein [Usitatibacteraceae bacterium]
MGRDGFTGLVVLAASVALFWATLGLEQNPLVPIGPAFYPRIVLGITAALAALLVAADVLAHRRAGGAPPSPRPRLRYAMVVALFALFGAYVVALPYAGFRIATFAFVAAMQAALEPPRGMRRWALVALVAFVATAGTYYTFDAYLKVLLPRGSWTDF